jgi:hypothetical protein
VRQQQPPGAERGCKNSTGLGGKLTSSGTASVSLDNLQLTATNMTGLISVFFQGTGVVSFNYGDGHLHGRSAPPRRQEADRRRQRHLPGRADP